VCADTGFAQLAGNAVPDFDDFVIFGCHYVQLLHVLLKQNRPFVWKRREEFKTVQEQHAYSSAKRLISRHPPLQEVIILGFL